jgi:hypothetical protein
MPKSDVKSDFNKLKTPADLLDFMNKNIVYGFVSRSGKKYLDQNSKSWDNDWFEKCIVQSGEELLKTKCGTCWDQVELERKWFNEHNYRFQTIFLWFGIPEPNDYPTHAFLVFNKNDKWYWFEHSFEKYAGIHKFDSLNKLIGYIKSRQLELAINIGVAKSGDSEIIKSYEYNKPAINLSVNDYINHVTSNPEIY